MNPLSTVFRAVVGVRNTLYDRGILHPRRLAGPVVSIGNLSVGGTGKTPFTILLGELLKARGIKFDVLTRGYGRSSRGVALVDCAGSARQFGDEPLLIARRLQVPVIVGEDRYDAGRFAEQKFGPQLHLLDDGFQHRQLARDFDIVLITSEDAHDRLLPAGRLREPLNSLARADAVVLTDNTSADEFPLAGRQVWRTRRGLRIPIVPANPVAFCGIARPQRFFRQLRDAGVMPVAEASFRDHHAYTERDIADLLHGKELSCASGGFITTEKDAINLGPALERLQPCAVVQVTMTLDDADSAADSLLHTIHERRNARA